MAQQVKALGSKPNDPQVIRGGRREATSTSCSLTAPELRTVGQPGLEETLSLNKTRWMPDS